MDARLGCLFRYPAQTTFFGHPAQTQCVHAYRTLWHFRRYEDLKQQLSEASELAEREDDEQELARATAAVARLRAPGPSSSTSTATQTEPVSM